MLAQNSNERHRNEMLPNNTAANMAFLFPIAFSANTDACSAGQLLVSQSTKYRSILIILNHLNGR